ncbi:UNKNOWN [Stylonychia lemnae]|uniref:Cyclic nucleotide-binding domain-containing protein n=1 Tax=Stylonychia lemnae TaxID=5949 RepID=A0A078A4B7_STYLE|nr:UNKNOWN [Stylonychia lemnae]|eukprot:CDW75609.1 UNKNOWN [Stylonychia lemnae]
MSSTKEKMNKSYIDNKLAGIFEPMVNHIFQENPPDTIEYMIRYLKDHYGNRPSINQNERMELDFLRQEVDKLKDMVGVEDDASENESIPSDEDEYIDDLPQVINANKQKGPRSSVSAEVFGTWNKKGDFKAPKYEKSDQIRDALQKRLEQAFMFSCLNPQELQIVLNAMQQVKKQPGDVIIREGDDGDNLYVVESGVLTCTKHFVSFNYLIQSFQKGNPEPTFLKEYHPGEAFGELSLLYNAPRAATIVAKTEAELWSLDRQTFNHIVKDAASQKRDKYEEFLKGVKILTNMDEYERSKLADAFKEHWFKPDEFVIREGEEGQTFYLVMSGKAVATKTLEPGNAPVEVFSYGPGDYFGERALMKNEPRAANIIAITTLQVVALDRHSFKRLLGPMEDILKRNMSLYKQYY